MAKKLTVVLGASENAERYSNKAVKMLTRYEHPVLAIGNRIGKIDDIDILKEKKVIENVDTITMYLNEQRQKEYYDYILSLKPKRIIFNPGAENDELVSIAEKENIKTIEACTLVMLATGQY